MSKRMSLIAVFILCTLALLAFSIHYKGWKPAALDEVTELNGRTELQKLYQLWLQPDSARSVRGRIRLYDGEDIGALREETTFSIQQAKGQLSSRIGPIQYLCDGNYLVQVDTLNRYLFVERAARGSQKSLSRAAFPFEQWLNDSAAFSLQVAAEQKGHERVLTLTSDRQPEIKTCRIYYDPLTYRIRQTEVEWWKQLPLAVITDTKQFWLTRIDYDYVPIETMDVEQLMGRFLQLKGRKVYPKSAYEDYQLNGALFNK